MWLLLGTVAAQTPDTAAVRRAVAPMLVDSVPATAKPDKAAFTLLDSIGQKLLDTVRISTTKKKPVRQIVPRIATMRSLMFPGLGQIYNRDYWKLPFVYGGFVVLGYYINTFTGSLNDFMAGYKEAYYSTAATKTAIVRGQVYGVQQLKSITDKYRSWRDGDIILALVLYGLTAVEANVSAHLKTFDLSEDLSMTVKPVMIPIGGLSPAPGVRISLTFK